VQRLRGGWKLGEQSAAGGVEDEPPCSSTFGLTTPVRRWRPRPFLNLVQRLQFRLFGGECLGNDALRRAVDAGVGDGGSRGAKAAAACLSTSSVASRRAPH
jgi:hypothetical protein